MKKNERLEALLNFLKDSPGDPFTIYGIALEYVEVDETEAGKYFGMLLEDHPDYLPTYYKAAEFYAEMGEQEKAIEIYTRGIGLAERMKETKTLAELRNAYQDLMLELD